MFRAPGPMDAVTASVACRWFALAKPDATCTRACSLRPWMNGRSSEYWSSACPRPATLPCPKMPRAAGMSRRRWPSVTLYCRDRYSTSAWAVVRRTVGEVMVFSWRALGSRSREGWHRGRRSPGAAVEDDGLLLGHLRDGGAEAFLADPGRLEAAVGHQIRAPQGGPVDVDDARVDLPHRLDGARDVAGEDAGPEPVRRGV